MCTTLCFNTKLGQMGCDLLGALGEGGVPQYRAAPTAQAGRQADGNG